MSQVDAEDQGRFPASFVHPQELRRVLSYRAACC
jgi:hypothetical protein